LKFKEQIDKIKFIYGSNVPIIKFVIDLHMATKNQIEKTLERLNKERKKENKDSQNQQAEAKSQTSTSLSLDLKLNI
jgi:hypothetical protein